MASFLALQQLLTALNVQLNNAPLSLGNFTSNATVPVHLDTSAMSTSLPSLLTFLISSSGLQDWFMLALMGALFELSRRIALYAYRKTYGHFFLTARFHEDDQSFCVSQP